jgi:hypothetical protein
MNKAFQIYVQLGRDLIRDRGLKWEIAVDKSGKANKGEAWNLSAMVGAVGGQVHYLSNLGSDLQIQDALQSKRPPGQVERTCGGPLSSSWQDLLKAVVAEQLFLRKNSTGHVVNSIVRPLRALATVASGSEPWQINADHVAAAVSAAREVQECGKLGDLVAGLIKTVFDQNHLADAGPLYPAIATLRPGQVNNRRAKYLKSTDEIRDSLEEKKRSERLPSKRAFWELVRIVMTETPLSFMDELRFAALRLLIVTGFRIGEATLLPADWLIEKKHVTPAGKSASDFGGIGQSMMIRHFAEKQNLDGGSSVTLCETATYVPRMFEKFLIETLGRVTQLTAPLRKTLRSQIETGRLLPWYEPSDLVPMPHLYPNLSGSPFWTEFTDQERERWKATCRNDPSGSEFDRLFQSQVKDYRGGYREVSGSAYVYFNRLKKAGVKNGTLAIRRADGSALSEHERLNWRAAFIRVDELENFLREGKQTKLTDVEPMRLENGLLQTWELMFIHPKRSLAEERADGICDLTRYFSINRPGPDFLNIALGEMESSESIFQRYGKTEEDKALVLRSHMLRHRLNNELFRLGVADTIITKQFSRKSVTESYEYDHRTLAEELDAVEIPQEVEFALGEKTATVYKMIKSERATGPIVDEFRHIQDREGDDAAFTFLRAEADGFHATPYGLCVSSFTVSPCPKHLQCFDGCRHLTSSPNPEARSNLKRLEIRLVATVEEIESRESSSLGRQNQLDHAHRTLEGVRTLLQTEPGRAAFPAGKDFSSSENGA